ncbi:MAG TPA: acylphosphatase [Verrucomicrobiae bacterium]|nr:acylphosphatase [Verrucomicrobiae bacterium]
MTDPSADRAASEPIARLEATVRGRVQGVGFRYYVLRKAAQLGLTGWVANELDGSVHCVVEGPAEDLDRLEELLRRGPMGAVVERVQVVRMPGTGRFERFEVRAAGHRGD